MLKTMCHSMHSFSFYYHIATMNQNKKADDEVRCINRKTGKVIMVRRFIAEDRNWQRATGFVPEEISPVNIPEVIQNTGAEQPTPPVTVPTAPEPSKSQTQPTPPVEAGTTIQPDDEGIKFDFTESGINEPDSPKTPERRVSSRVK